MKEYLDNLWNMPIRDFNLMLLQVAAALGLCILAIWLIAKWTK